MKKLIDIARRVLRFVLWSYVIICIMAVIASILTFNIIMLVPSATLTFVGWKIIHLLETRDERIERAALSFNERIELDRLKDFRGFELELLRTVQADYKSSIIDARIKALREVNKKVEARAKELRAAGVNNT